ncbi:hypothetical protein [Rubinisphaera sp.]|uniref:hypothetical protein n=1 Tax=Rubinisphaera sp. TaxID=2024857 RepID=UPI0025F34356|nr:hypothetical protein [Rubinisphaera sp.]|tara:strand:+ start:5298 stop:5462 length:165 start_codon:yes stop_codon:yes gene_type:complete
MKAEGGKRKAEEFEDAGTPPPLSAIRYPLLTPWGLRFAATPATRNKEKWPVASG